MFKRVALATLLVGLSLGRTAHAAELVMSKYRVRCPAGIVAPSPGGKAMAFELGAPSAVLPVLMSDPAHFREQELTAVQLGADPLVVGWVRTSELPTVALREVFLAPTPQAGDAEVGVRLEAGAAVTVVKRTNGMVRVRHEAPETKVEGWVPADALGTFFEAVPATTPRLKFLSYTPARATFFTAPRGKPMLTIKGAEGSAIWTTGRVEKGYELAFWSNGVVSVRGWYPQAKVVAEEHGLYGNVVATAEDRDRLEIDVPGGTAVLDAVGGHELGQFIVGARDNLLLEQRDGASRIYVWTRLGRFAAWVPVAPTPHPQRWFPKP